MKIEVSVGEIVDKLSILKIKSDNITDLDKLKNLYFDFDNDEPELEIDGDNAEESENPELGPE